MKTHVTRVWLFVCCEMRLVAKQHKLNAALALFVAPHATQLMLYHPSACCHSLQLSYLKGDPRKPVVLLYPFLSTLKKGKDKVKRKVDPSAGFVVRLLPCCGRGVMAPARLAPGRNNVRTRC